MSILEDSWEDMKGEADQKTKTMLSAWIKIHRIGSHVRNNTGKGRSLRKTLGISLRHYHAVS